MQSHFLPFFNGILHQSKNVENGTKLEKNDSFSFTHFLSIKQTQRSVEKSIEDEVNKKLFHINLQLIS